MIAIPIITLPEVVPQSELLAWRRSIRRAEADKAPAEVTEFIEALAAKLPDYGRVGMDLTVYTGKELKLCGLNVYEGQQVVDFAVYQLKVPRLQATDEALTMYRIYKRKGKPGLIDYCRAKVKGTELEKLLYILNVHVFKIDRPEYREVMDRIMNSNQLTVDTSTSSV